MGPHKSYPVMAYTMICRVHHPVIGELPRTHAHVHPPMHTPHPTPPTHTHFHYPIIIATCFSRVVWRRCDRVVNSFDTEDWRCSATKLTVTVLPPESPTCPRVTIRKTAVSHPHFGFSWRQGFRIACGLPCDGPEALTIM